jgi:predicted ATPase/DNA-binding SARP family transcriptional activator
MSLLGDACNAANHSLHHPFVFPKPIGRETEFQTIITLLQQTRLLTLTGPGGCGKTCLALHIAAERRADYSDGIWFIELAQISDPALVPQAVADVFGLSEVPMHTLVQNLQNYLSDRKILLILDNCEHVIEACAHLAGLLLLTCPDLQILATSREVLRVSHEVSWIVPALALPQNDDVPYEEIQRYSAIQLFIRQAQTVSPGFVPNIREARLITRVCRFLDGMPLAIELAAARLKMVTVEQLIEMLERDLTILAGGQRFAMPHQQALDATIAWSYALLQPTEQALFRYLSAFTGSFDLEIVSALWGQPLSASLDVLTRLVDKSMVVAELGSPEICYHLLETLRQYGQEQLRLAGEEAVVYGRYAQRCLMLLDKVNQRLAGFDKIAWLQRMMIEHTHIRTLLSWFITQQRGEEALELCINLVAFWMDCGSLGEGYRWLETCMDASHPPAPLQAWGWISRGLLALHRGDYQHSLSDYDRAMPISEQVHDQNITAAAVLGRGVVYEKLGRFVDARADLEQGIQLFRSLQDWQHAGQALHCLATVEHRCGNFATAMSLYREAIEQLRATPTSSGLATTLHDLGTLEFNLGNYAGARTIVEESLAIARTCANSFAITAALAMLGEIAIHQGDLTKATHFYREGLMEISADGSKAIIREILNGLATIAALRHQIPRAARLWGATAAISADIGYQISPVEEASNELQRQLIQEHEHEPAFKDAWQAGKNAKLADMLTFAQIDSSNDSARSIEMQQRVIPLKIQALGQAEVWIGDHVLEKWTYSKAKELLFYLATFTTGSKEQIGLALWPDASEEQIRTNFRVILHHLRRSLGYADWIVYAHHEYRFQHTLPHWYDVASFQEKIRESQRILRAEPEHARSLLEEAIQIYQGDFLSTMSPGEWIVQQQNMLRSAQENALLLLGQLYTNLGQYLKGQETLQRLIARDPYHEAAHRELIRGYILQGEHTQAMRLYRDLQERLQRELGITPGPKITALLRQITQFPVHVGGKSVSMTTLAAENL